MIGKSDVGGFNGDRILWRMTSGAAFNVGLGRPPEMVEGLGWSFFVGEQAIRSSRKD